MDRYALREFRLSIPALSDMRDIPIAIILFVSVLLFGLAFLPPTFYEADGQSMLAVAESIIMKHNLTVPEYLGVIGLDSQHYSAHYPLLSIVVLPFVIFGLLISNLVHLPAHYIVIVFALILSSLITAFTVSFVFLLSRSLGGTNISAFYVSLSYFFGTIALVYSRQFFAEPLLALLTIVSIYIYIYIETIVSNARRGSAKNCLEYTKAIVPKK